MDERLKQRLVGAAVLVLVAVIFVPMLLDQDGGDPQQPARIIPRPPPEPMPPPLPEDASARSVPLDGNRRLAAPAPAAPAVQTPPAKTVNKAAPTAPAATRPKPGFAVQVGSFSKVGNARGLRDKLVAKGYTAFVKSSGSVTRVYVGPQSSRGEADKVLKKLLAELQLKGIVVQPPG
jgi:DedD protein